MRGRKIPTFTSRMLETLRGANDYVTVNDLIRLSGMDRSHAFASLCHLHKSKAVDFIRENGVTYWFALPPEVDTRIHVLNERTPENKPRRKRRTAKVEK